MKDNTLIKFVSVATWVCVACTGVALLPVPVIVLILLFGLLMVLLALVWGFFCCFIWLFTQSSLFGVCLTMFGLAAQAFSILSPISVFSIRFLTPTFSGIGLLFGIIGIISSAALLRRGVYEGEDSEADMPIYSNRGESQANSHKSRYADADMPLAPQEPTGVIVLQPRQQPDSGDGRGRKRRARRHKLGGGAMAACIIFSILCLIALLVAITPLGQEIIQSFTD